MFCIEVSISTLYTCRFVFQSVTAYGRAMIDQTKQEVEQHYNVANGYQHDAEVGSNATVKTKK